MTKEVINTHKPEMEVGAGDGKWTDGWGIGWGWGVLG